MKFQLVMVDRFPASPEAEILYWSQEFEISGHLCACGCGDFIQLPITPVDFRIISGAGGPTLRPSVGNWNVCDAHYYITDGEVQWLAKLTASQISAGREAEDKRRALYYAPGRYSFLQRVRDSVANFLKHLGIRR